MGCCTKNAQRLTVFDCFERGQQTRRLAPLSHVGREVSLPGGITASFSLAADNNRLTDIRFTCTSCATLIACCQALVELNRNFCLDTPAVRDRAGLLLSLPGLPATKHDRVALAVTAFHAALELAVQQTQRKKTTLS